LSSDYFGVVANELAAALQPESPDRFVGMMANATSGDANCIDFSRPARPFNYKEVGQYVAGRILESLPRIEYRRDVVVDSDFTWLSATIRKPSPEEAKEAEAYVASRSGGSIAERSRRKLCSRSGSSPARSGYAAIASSSVLRRRFRDRHLPERNV
jgi:hypothetical protein